MPVEATDTIFLIFSGVLPILYNKEKRNFGS